MVFKFIDERDVNVSNIKRIVTGIGVALTASGAFAGPNWAAGQVTSLQAHPTDPGIRLTGNVSPDLCDGGTYGWLYFYGTAEERHRVYATALAMALAGKEVTVYTNTNGATCRISNIQVTSGLN